MFISEERGWCVWEEFLSLCAFLYKYFLIYEKALIEKVVTSVSPKDWRVFHRRQEVGVGGVRVRASLTHRISYENGLHRKGQNKKNRVSTEVSRLEQIQGLHCLETVPVEGFSWVGVVKSPGNKDTSVRTVRTTDRQKHLGMWQFSNHSHLKNSGGNWRQWYEELHPNKMISGPRDEYLEVPRTRVRVLTGAQQPHIRTERT